MRMRVQVRSFEGICRMIASGLGIGVLPNEAVSTHVATLNLHMIELTDTWAHREFRIAYRDFDNLPVLAREMVEHLPPTSEALPLSAPPLFSALRFYPRDHSDVPQSSLSMVRLLEVQPSVTSDEDDNRNQAG
nr:LysR substrate-binding domain-containing protein [Salinisphaera sp. LB1]